MKPDLCLVMKPDLCLVLLYGPPASGKDTITRALTRQDERYQLFKRLKCGPGRTDTYRMITPEQLQDLRSIPGEVLWENSRYGATYVFDRSQLNVMLTERLLPVLHIGQADAIPAITKAVPDARPLIVSLTCPRDIARSRIEERGTGDTSQRLAAYDSTKQLTCPDLILDTSAISPAQAAEQIDLALAVLQ
jgi:guanylate kinase